MRRLPVVAVLVALSACGDDGGEGPGGAGIPTSAAGPGSGPSTASGSTATSSGTTGTGGGSVSEWPDETNTGIPDGACPNGLADATIDEIEPQSGSVIECVRFMNDVPYVRQDVTDVTYRYCLFESDVDTFLNLQGGPVIFEDSEFSGPAGTWIRASYESHGLTVRRCEFEGMANAVEWGVDDVVIHDNWVHDFGNVDPEQHADGFQTEGANNFSIVHNTIHFNDVDGSTSCLLVAGSASEVRDNLLAGGGYTLHVAGDVDVTGNRFSTMFHDTCGFYGPIYPEALDPGSEWSNNVWHDGPDEGQELPAP